MISINLIYFSNVLIFSSNCDIFSVTPPIKFNMNMFSGRKKWEYMIVSFCAQGNVERNMYFQRYTQGRHPDLSRVRMLGND